MTRAAAKAGRRQEESGDEKLIGDMIAHPRWEGGEMERGEVAVGRIRREREARKGARQVS
jgi:hypothetical protein